jgi:thiamine biosynthesis protein ThiI
LKDRTALDHRVLIRLSGELATKSRQTRRSFQRRLRAALSDALAASGAESRFHDEWGRIFVEASSLVVLDVLPRVWGVASISPVEAKVAPRLDEIVAVGERVYADRVRGRSFAVRARRSGRHPFSSKDVNIELGSALNRYGRVDLKRPDLTVGVEVRDDAAYLFSERIPGPGGLPLGVEGPGLALISGGFDSAVAAWMMLKRGVAVDYVFCNLAGPAYERAVLAVARLLAEDWSYGYQPRMHVVDFEAVVGQLRERVTESFWQLVLKRLMYRAGEQIARETGALAIITGESLGQVSSQTLANLGAITQSVSTPVLRPLLGFDKLEIIERSRVIGTYGLSEKVREYCALAEERPVTAASAEQAAAQEARLDLSVLANAVALRRVLDLRRLDPTDLVMPYLYSAEVPVDACVVDTRSRTQYEDWHYPGAIHRDFWELFNDFASLDRSRTYLLYCGLGLRTAQLAEKLQRAGFTAYSFKGGVRALREYERSRGTQVAAPEGGRYAG